MVVQADFLDGACVHPSLGDGAYVFTQAGKVLRLEDEAVRMVVGVEWQNIAVRDKVLRNPVWCVDVVVVVVAGITVVGVVWCVGLAGGPA